MHLHNLFHFQIFIYLSKHLNNNFHFFDALIAENKRIMILAEQKIYRKLVSFEVHLSGTL